MNCVIEPERPAIRHFQADYRFAEALLAIFRLVQRHRALCAGWPQGEAGAPVGRESVACAVTAGLAACRAGRAVESARQDFLEDIETRWQSLLASDGESPDMLFLRHCRLIERLQVELEGLAAAWAELDRERDNLLSVYARQLPELAECLGQLRGIGCSVAAERECSAFRRTRLLFLCSSAQALLGAVCQRYQGLAPPVEARVARTACDSLVHLLRAEFLREEVSHPVADFYRLATESIDTVFVWIDAVGNDLVRSLTVRRRAAQ